jgi:hypothetical protein
VSARSRGGRDNVELRLRLRLREAVRLKHSPRLPPLWIDLTASESDRVVDLLSVLVDAAVRVVLDFAVLGGGFGRRLDGIGVLGVVSGRRRRGELRRVVGERRASDGTEIGL